MSIQTGHTEKQRVACEEDQSFSAFCRSRTPEQWAWAIKATFSCKVMRAWVASVIWWRFQVLKVVPAMDALLKLMDDYPNEDNPYPLMDIEEAFEKLGGKARVDKHVKLRDLSRMERQRKFPDAPARGPVQRLNGARGKRHYGLRY